MIALFSHPSDSIHRDLHSFPTRRSSDLPVADQPQLLRARVPQPDREHAAEAIERPDTTLVERVEDDLRVGVVGAPRDRKSTRLNSSHVEISYAVFCLKKKKRPLIKTPIF